MKNKKSVKKLTDDSYLLEKTIGCKVTVDEWKEFRHFSIERGFTARDIFMAGKKALEKQKGR